MSRKEIMKQIHKELYVNVVGAYGGGHLIVRDFSDKKASRKRYALMLENAASAFRIDCNRTRSELLGDCND